MSATPQVLMVVQGRLGRYLETLKSRAERTLKRSGRRLGLGPDHQISLLLCDNPTIHRLNRQWRDVDRPTDVLSFPAWELEPGDRVPEAMVGDIAVSLPTTRLAARQLGLAEGDHMDHLLIHGLLHLLGYDHETEAQACRMEALEQQLLGEE